MLGGPIFTHSAVAFYQETLSTVISLEKELREKKDQVKARTNTIKKTFIKKHVLSFTFLYLHIVFCINLFPEVIS